VPAARDIIWVALLIFVVAAFLGIVINVTRLVDFRWTTRSARIRELRNEYDSDSTSSSCRGTDTKIDPYLPTWVESIKPGKRKEFSARDIEALQRTIVQLQAIHRQDQQSTVFAAYNSLPEDDRKKVANAPENVTAHADSPLVPLYQKHVALTLGAVHERCRYLANRWGECTWTMIPGQFIVFFLGIVVLAIGMWSQSHR